MRLPHATTPPTRPGRPAAPPAPARDDCAPRRRPRSTLPRRSPDGAERRRNPVRPVPLLAAPNSVDRLGEFTPSSPGGPIAGPARRYGRTTRSSRWTTSWGTPSGRSRCAGRPPPAGRRRRGGRGPWRTPARRAPAISTARRRRSAPLTPITPAGSSETPRSSSARRAPSSTHDRARRARRRRRSTACGPAGAAAGDDHGAHAGLAGHGLGEHAGRSAAAMTARTPGPGGDLGRRQLGGHPPAAPGRPGAAGHRLEGRGRPRRSPR